MLSLISFNDSSEVSTFFFPSLFFDGILYVFVYGCVAIGIGRLKLSYMWFHQTNLHSNLYIGKGLQDPGRKSAFDWSSGCVLAVADVVCLWPSFDLIRRNWFNSIRHHHEVLWTFLELRHGTSEGSRADERWFMTSCLQPASFPAEAASPPSESQILASRRVQTRFREDLAQPHLSVGWKNNLISQLPQTSWLKNSLFPHLQRVGDYISSSFHPFFERRLWR